MCAMLHNICKARNIPLPDDNVEDAVEGHAAGEQFHLDPAIPAARNRHPFRDYIANLHFKWVLFFHVKFLRGTIK